MRLITCVLSLVCFSGVAAAQQQSFINWREQFRDEALAAGITPETFDSAMGGVKPIAHVLELDHEQPEVRLPFSDYVRKVASEERRAGVRQHLDEERTLLAQVGRRFGVQPPFIVALWGVETDFGRVGGDYPVIAALATLAYDGRRAALFSRELIAALRIVQRDDIPPAELRGSWAGAMGQCQFMPSSFLSYAVSFHGNGRPDIWHNRADIFASIANYLARLGWRDGESWGRYVDAMDVPADMVGLGIRKPLHEWQRLGVRRSDGGLLPATAQRASLLMPEGEGGPSLLVYGNFRTLLRWNNSQAFATSVGLLAEHGESR